MKGYGEMTSRGRRRFVKQVTLTLDSGVCVCLWDIVAIWLEQVGHGSRLVRASWTWQSIGQSKWDMAADWLEQVGHCSRVRFDVRFFPEMIAVQEHIDAVLHL